jgi:hypothetical protein
MPYIKKEDRIDLDECINDLEMYINNEKPGELCYVIYKVLNDLTKENKCFKTMSSLISEVECAKLEFYRRIVAPYEDKKIEENGDVQ